MTNRSLKRPSKCQQSRQSDCPKSKLGTLKVELAVCQEEFEEEIEEQCGQSEDESEDCPQPCPPPPCNPAPQCKSDSSCQSKSSSKVNACCKPGCSKRMPCLSCTKKGCIGEIPGRDQNKRDRKCQKPCGVSNEKFKIRSKSEARVRDSGCFKSGGGCKQIKETCAGDSKKECHPKKSKPPKRAQPQCKTPASSCDEVEVCQKPPERKSKSPCRELKVCPCDDCKNVKFNEKCDMIPGPYSSCDNSCDEDEYAKRSQCKPKSRKCGTTKATRCPPCDPTRKTEIRPRSKSCSPDSFREEQPCAQEKFEKKCDCIVCSLGQSSASNFMGFDDQIANGLQLKLPQTFASNSGGADWPPPTAACNCGSPNCSTTFRFSSSRF